MLLKSVLFSAVIAAAAAPAAAGAAAKSASEPKKSKLVTELNKYNNSPDGSSPEMSPAGETFLKNLQKCDELKGDENSLFLKNLNEIFADRQLHKVGMDRILRTMDITGKKYGDRKVECEPFVVVKALMEEKSHGQGLLAYNNAYYSLKISLDQKLRVALAEKSLSYGWKAATTITTWDKNLLFGTKIEPFYSLYFTFGWDYINFLEKDVSFESLKEKATSIATKIFFKDENVTDFEDKHLPYALKDVNWWYDIMAFDRATIYYILYTPFINIINAVSRVIIEKIQNDIGGTVGIETILGNNAEIQDGWFKDYVIEYYYKVINKNQLKVNTIANKGVTISADCEYTIKTANQFTDIDNKCLIDEAKDKSGNAKITIAAIPDKILNVRMTYKTEFGKPNFSGTRRLGVDSSFDWEGVDSSNCDKAKIYINNNNNKSVVCTKSRPPIDRTIYWWPIFGEFIEDENTKSECGKPINYEYKLEGSQSNQILDDNTKPYSLMSFYVEYEDCEKGETSTTTLLEAENDYVNSSTPKILLNLTLIIL